MSVPQGVVTTVEAEWAKHGPANERLSEFDRGTVVVTRSTFSRLKPVSSTNPHCPSNHWLDDHMIEAFGLLINDSRPGYYVMTHRFWLTGRFGVIQHNGQHNFERARRYTDNDRVDIFSLRKLLMPLFVNGNHWTLIAVDFELKLIEYWDSGAEFGDGGGRYLEIARAYLVDAWKRDHPGTDPPPHWIRDWKLIEGSQRTPQQLNTWDCGVFVCCIMDLMSQGIPQPAFTQQDLIDYQYRHRIAYALLKKRLSYDEEGNVN
jgi:sentrin-specific protease 1